MIGDSVILMATLSIERSDNSKLVKHVEHRKDTEDGTGNS